MHLTPRRFGKAMPCVLLVAGLAIAVNIPRHLPDPPGDPKTPVAQATNMLTSPYFYICVVALGAIVFQTWVNYVSGWYSPNLALKYQDLWESEKVRKSRSAAATEFKSNKTYSLKTKEVETVLDVIEDIGFYVKNDEMSV